MGAAGAWVSLVERGSALRWLMVCIVCFAWPVAAVAAAATVRSITVPGTISEPAQHLLEQLEQQKPWQTAAPAVTDAEAWSVLRERADARGLERARQWLEHGEVSIEERTMDAVPVLDIRPLDWRDNGQVIVFLHGGAFTLNSARGTLANVVPVALASGLRVISVDYGKAPQTDWWQMQQQVLAVFRRLLADGYAMDRIGVYGASAGGGLAISSILAGRSAGLGWPAALVLWSPWVDLSPVGDTMETLRDADPILDYDALLKPSAEAYAAGLALDDPRISPIYGSFAEGFPPTLIQDSTKTIFLSGSVRLYRHLDGAGKQVVLDLYEGLPHVFQQFSLPESAMAISKTASFLLEHLAESPGPAADP
jgi:epsilon-lactone hydrolase